MCMKLLLPVLQLKSVGPDVFDPAIVPSVVSLFCFPGLHMGGDRLTQIIFRFQFLAELKTKNKKLNVLTRSLKTLLSSTL